MSVRLVYTAPFNMWARARLARFRVGTGWGGGDGGGEGGLVQAATGVPGLRV